MRNNRYSYRYLSAFAVFALSFVLSQAAAAAPRCFGDAEPLTAERRGSLWAGSIQAFVVRHPNLSVDQLRVLSAGVNLAGLISNDGVAGQQDALRTYASFVKQASGVFSNSDLGEIFAPMGRLQFWLVENQALATPYCNCSGSGACQFSGGPTGNCNAGCISWDSSFSSKSALLATRYDGLCEAAN